MNKTSTWKKMAVMSSLMSLTVFSGIIQEVVRLPMVGTQAVAYQKQPLENYQLVDGKAKSEIKNGQLQLTEVGEKALFIDPQSPSFENSESELNFNIERDNANIGVVFRYQDPKQYVAITVQTGGSGGHWPSVVWRLRIPGKPDKELFKDFTKIHGGRKAPCWVKVRLVGQHLTIYFDSTMVYEGIHSEIPKTSGKNGFIIMQTNGRINSFAMSKAEEMKAIPIALDKALTLKNDQLVVRLDGTFPRVIDYQVPGVEDVLKGQPDAFDYVDVNGHLYAPQVKVKKRAKSYVVYQVRVLEIGEFDVRFSLADNVLTLKIENASESIKTVNFPNNHLISMDIASVGAQYAETNMSGQRRWGLAKQPITSVMQYTRIPVLYNNKLAATMSNNSFKGACPVAYEVYQAVDGKKYAGLNSNEYVLQYALDEILGEKTGNDTARVAVVSDLNKDNKVDVQDGLIAYRDDIRFRHKEDGMVRDNSFSVAMNVGSCAQYPFLRILDNVKKISMLTDNFGQAIIIKGYQDEGHDAAHPDYANYNERAGGLKDFKTLLEKAPKYGGNIGIHINHTETYPEAEQFNALQTQSSGWNWYDTAKVLDRTNDILNRSKEGMNGRLEQLAEDTFLSDGKTPGIKFVYVDTYFEKRWVAKKLADKLNALGWPMGTENLPNFPGRSMFAHHGENPNSTQLIRYVHNSDIAYVSGGTIFRGTTDGGYSYRSGINGWQYSWNLPATLEEFYKNVLPGKYLQYFPIMEWDNFGNQAKLGKNKEVETSGVGDNNIIKKDGKIIANGNTIFIPWDPIKETKIYHYNLKGGTTTWELPNSWRKVKTVYLYTLTDIGRVNEQKIKVVDGKVTLEAKAKVPYVLYKRAQKTPTAAQIKWGEGTFIKDGGFDSHDWNYAWERSSTANTVQHISFVNNQHGNTIIEVKGKEDAIISQTITGLEGGKKYSASVWVLVAEGCRRKTQISVQAGNQTFSNEIVESNFKYGHTHTDKLNTKWQRVDVDFIQPKGKTTAVLTFKAATTDNDKAVVFFDNARVVQIDWTDKGEHYFVEDFESFREAFGPFVSNATDESHLSEKIPEATSVKDVIDGTFSLKIRKGNYMRTLPHTLRLLPNKTYRVSIMSKQENDQGLPEGAFTLAAKVPQNNQVLASQASTKCDAGKVSTTTITFSTGDHQDAYIDITAGKSKNYILDNLIVDEVK